MQFYSAFAEKRGRSGNFTILPFFSTPVYRYRDLKALFLCTVIQRTGSEDVPGSSDESQASVPGS